MRIAVAELVQETDSFSPLRTGLDEFEAYGILRGAEIVERLAGAGPIGGLLAEVAARRQPVELVPLLRAWAGAGGPLRDATFLSLRRELADRLSAALPVDALFFSLHGAAAAESDDDVEGALLQDARDILGDAVPIVVPLDHHANITRRMVDHADLLVGHETQPHDTVATGRKAALLMFQILDGQVAPAVAWQKLPMMTPQDQFLTSAGPMREWFDQARRFEQLPGVLDVSPYPMQPWLDAAEGGWSVVVHTNRDLPLARRLAADMAALAWQLRRDFWRSERVPPAEAVRRSLDLEGLVVLSDTGDSVYGGSPGDSTCLLAELVAQPGRSLSLVPVVDPQAIASAWQAGVGAAVTLPLGGRATADYCRPVEVAGRVAALSQGLSVEVPGWGISHVGRTALVECGTLRIALLERRSFAVNHPLLYAHLGVDVSDAGRVVVKTASNFQFFARWRKHLIRADTPGPTQANLAAFPWRRLPRPIDPFDPIADWQPDPRPSRRTACHQL
jgi:microcystin degradation protein MlrC